MNTPTTITVYTEGSPEYTIVEVIGSNIISVDIERIFEETGADVVVL